MYKRKIQIGRRIENILNRTSLKKRGDEILTLKSEHISYYRGNHTRNYRFPCKRKI